MTANRLPDGGGRAVGARLLPIVALSVAILVVVAVLASSGSTVGYDAHAYLDAAHRLLGGQAVYDASINQAGPAGQYLYPPPFTLLAVPFTLLPDPYEVAGWTVAILVAFGLGVAVLPVSRDVRWLIVLLAGLSWPFVYGVKLGQVGPLLFLCFAAGWRWMDRPARLGVAIAVGTIIKLQPAILLVWAALGRRWVAIGVALAVLASAAAVSVAVGGLEAWGAWLAILRSISAPITTPHNFTPGAIAYQAGTGEEVATVIQAVNSIAVVVLVVWAGLRASPAVGYLAAVTASQLLSPVLWDHYAMLLLLPTAWLLERRQWWAAAIPLATSIVLIWLPPIVYPISFWVGLVAPLVVDRRSGRPLPAQRPGSQPVLSSEA